jgi:translation initiation factor IF-1
MPEAAGGEAPALSARVVEILPSALFRVELAGQGRPQATVHLAPEAGLLRVRPGDAVLVRLSPVDPGWGRIVGLQ